MQQRSDSAERDRVWDLIKGAHTALLVSIGEDGVLDSRPMGCLQREFDGTLWFLTFRHSSKLYEISKNDQVLVSYATPAKGEYVSVSGRCQLINDPEKIKQLWNEGLRVWFPKGPEDPEIALIAVDVETARYWTQTASAATYAWAYVRSRLTGKTPAPEDIADVKRVQF
jgi:general stress protein 26